METRWTPAVPWDRRHHEAAVHLAAAGATGASFVRADVVLVISSPDGSDLVDVRSTRLRPSPTPPPETRHPHPIGIDLGRPTHPISTLEVRVDPHLVIVAKELAHRRLTTDQTLLIFSALPDAPVRAVTPPNRLRRLMNAVRARSTSAGPRAESTYADTCQHRTNSSTCQRTTWSPRGLN